MHKRLERGEEVEANGCMSEMLARKVQPEVVDPEHKSAAERSSLD